MSKLGTGEGAQAYGHGLYFAENEDVALGYKNDLTKSRTLYEKDGVGDTADTLRSEINHAVLSNSPATSNQSFVVTKKILDGLNDGDNPAEYRKFLEKNRWDMADMEQWEIDATIAGLKKAEEYKAIKPKGAMYEVEIDATPDELLDWDAPIGGQPVQDKFNKAFPGVDPESDFRDFSDNFDDSMGYPEIAQKLNDAGIKGIKYKDGFSRGADGGTSNYVIFDDRLISISKKYGLAIPAAAALLAEQTGEDTEGFYDTQI